ncbi:collagen alpha-1(I) chain-like isoform X12 [Anopheles darlingi]|uniref:collagen alpha-1(I) chain-like isoform X12 n=1 Tax=Anopheles darlingi TaxID=43151 RepID=UPI0021002027|nr:collagen alpha-1(I) chain-like isoform X12 [Anopheles darlingi]
MLLRVGVVVLGLCLTLVRAADDVIECTTDDDKKGECVKLHLCRNGVINDDGANIIDIRFNPDNVCEDYLLKCCAIPEDEDDQVLVPPSSSLPQQPVTGNQVGPTAGSNPGVTGLNAGGATNVPGTPGPIAPSPTPDVLDLASGKPKPSSGVGGGAGVGSCNCKGSGKCCGPHLEDEQLTLIGGDLYSGGGKPNSENLIKENNPQQPVHGGGPPIDSPRPNPSGGQGQGPIGAGGQPGAGGAGGQTAVKPGQGPIGTGGQPGAGGAGPAGGQSAVKPGQGPIGTGGQPGAGPSGGQSAVKPGQGPIGAGGQPGAGGAGGQSAGGQGQGPLGAGSQPGAGGAGPSVGQSTVKPGQGTGQGQPSAGGAGSSGGQNAANPGAGGAKPSPAGIKGSGGGSKDRTGQGTTQSPFASTVQPQKCGLRNVDGVGFRITGDKDGESEYGEFPWMVAILKQEKALDQIIHVYQCGGSLIHPSVVLTAAHCVLDKNPQDITLRLGEWDTQTKNEMFDYQDRKAVEIVTHAEFYKGGLFNDVALVFLDKPAELMETVNTICLPPPDFNFDASRCFASGWGKDVFGKQGTYQVILKKIELPVMPRAQCQTALRTTRLGRRFKLHGSFICAGGEKGRDTCKGDGGSPLVCPIPGSVNHYYQAGMVAWGIGCGEDGIPGVYVNVPLFRGWIDQHLTQRNISHSSFLYA